MRVIQELPVNHIYLDRVPLVPQTLDLVRHLENGGSVPPIHVVKDVSGWRVLDGRHRLAAYRLLGRERILVRFGTSVSIQNV